MLRVKAVVSGMSVSLKGNASARKTWKMWEGHVQVCLEIITIIIILYKAGFNLMTFLRQYGIYSINRPGRLLNFWTLRVGAYSRWALIRGWALIRINTVLKKMTCEVRMYAFEYPLPRGCDWFICTALIGPHFTTTTRIPQGFAFLCQLGFLLFKPR